MKKLLITTIVLGIFVTKALGFSAGVPPLPTVCKSLTPQHGNYTPQISEAPFQISVEPLTVKTGDTVTVTLRSTGDSKFKGFYVQGRGENGNPIGHFRTNKLTDTHSCGGVRWNGAHHSHGQEEKDVVMIKWEAPKNYEGEVNFIGSFVKNYVTIWVGVYSDPITVILSNVTQNTRGPLLPLNLFRRTSQNRTSLFSAVPAFFSRIFQRSKLLSLFTFSNNSTRH